MAAPGQHTVYVHQPAPHLQQQQQLPLQQQPKPGRAESYNSHAGRATGWIQLCLGVAAVLTGVAQWVLQSPIRYGSFAIWAGILFYAPAGLLGICSTSKKNSVIGGYMAMSIVAAIFACLMMIVGAISAPISTALGCYPSSSGSDCIAGFGEGRVASDAIMAVIGLVEMVVAIVASAYCCAGVCCQKSHSPVQTSVITYPHVIVSTGNPQGLAYQQTTMQPPMQIPSEPPAYSATPQPQPQPPPQQAYQPLLYPAGAPQPNAGLRVQLPPN